MGNLNPVGVSSHTPRPGELSFCIEVQGYVVAKPRPRFTRAGHTYTPSRAQEAEHRIAEAWSWGMLCGPLSLEVLVFVRRPKSHYGAHGLKESAPALPLTRPDGDNYLKTACDALNGVAWQDDASVTDMTVRKRYGSPEGWRITVEELG